MLHLSSLHSLSFNKYSSPTSIFNTLNSSHPTTHSEISHQKSSKTNNVNVVAGKSICSCGRRHFVGASGTLWLPTFHANASEIISDSKAQDMLNRIHPPRPDWYEEFYASAMENTMKPYEDEIAGYKVNLFTKLRGKSKVLELGIGTGPNLRYYAGDSGVFVFGVDPNKKMEKYAQAAAAAVGLPPTHFSFTEAVGEALPVGDASMDVVIGTLVLCSVKDVALTLQEVRRVLKPGGLYLFIEHVAAKDGTPLKFIQSVLDPLQQIVADGCHLTRETGKYISQAGFSQINMETAFLSNASLIGPHVYGIASK